MQFSSGALLYAGVGLATGVRQSFTLASFRIACRIFPPPPPLKHIRIYSYTDKRRGIATKIRPGNHPSDSMRAMRLERKYIPRTRKRTREVLARSTTKYSTSGYTSLVSISLTAFSKRAIRLQELRSNASRTAVATTRSKNHALTLKKISARPYRPV